MLLLIQFYKVKQLQKVTNAVQQQELKGSVCKAEGEISTWFRFSAQRLPAQNKFLN